MSGNPRIWGEKQKEHIAFGAQHLTEDESLTQFPTKVYCPYRNAVYYPREKGKGVPRRCPRCGRPINTKNLIRFVDASEFVKLTEKAIKTSGYVNAPGWSSKR